MAVSISDRVQIDLRGLIGLIIAIAFIVGCICFYFESLYVEGVTAFLIGSVFMLLDALLAIFRRQGSVGSNG